MNCPERPYECMISTLKKFPWFMTELVTIKQRHYIYNAALKMIGFLKETIDRAANPARSNRDRDRAPNADRLTIQLFNRLIAAAMSCPGFTVNQKDNIAYLAYMDEGGMRSFNQPRLADAWRHQYALGVKPGAPLDVVEVSYFRLSIPLHVTVTLTDIKLVLHCSDSRGDKPHR